MKKTKPKKNEPKQPKTVPATTTAPENQPAPAITHAAVVRRSELDFKALVSRDTETGDIEVTPFYNGYITASIRFSDSNITIAPNHNWRFPFRLINQQKQELWLTKEALMHILKELNRYFTQVD